MQPLPEPSATYVPQLSAGVNAGAIYNTYLRIRDAPDSHYSKLSSFYFDVANALFTYDKHLAIRTLSSLAELEYDDPQPLRYVWLQIHTIHICFNIVVYCSVMAYRLEMEVAEYNDSVLDLTISVFRRISEMRPEEPQVPDILFVCSALSSHHYSLTGTWQRYLCAKPFSN